MKVMNRLRLIIFLCIAVSVSNCNNIRNGGPVRSDIQTTDTGTAIISFREYEHNFGKVSEGEKIAYTFTLENKGTANLVLTAATTTCGCTVSKYDTKPIAPGKTGNIEVIFDTSDRDGMQTKTITVKSNASVPVVLLKITAEVVNAR
jgi:hypothetical protein